MINCFILTGDRILYLDLSSDPDLFKGPKGDKQVRNAYLELWVPFLLIKLMIVSNTSSQKHIGGWRRWPKIGGKEGTILEPFYLLIGTIPIYLHIQSSFCMLSFLVWLNIYLNVLIFATSTSFFCCAFEPNIPFGIMRIWKFNCNKTFYICFDWFKYNPHIHVQMVIWFGIIRFGWWHTCGISLGMFVFCRNWILVAFLNLQFS